MPALLQNALLFTANLLEERVVVTRVRTMEYTVVKQLLELAADPENQATICQEKECLKGLVYYLTVANDDIAATAAKALVFLSASPKNRELLKEFPDLVNNLVS